MKKTNPSKKKKQKRKHEKKPQKPKKKKKKKEKVSIGADSEELPRVFYVTEARGKLRRITSSGGGHSENVITCLS